MGEWGGAKSVWEWGGVESVCWRGKECGGVGRGEECVGVGRGGEWVVEGRRVCGSGEGWTVCVGGAKSVWESEVLSLSVRATKKRTFFAASLIGQPFISPPPPLSGLSIKKRIFQGWAESVCVREGRIVCVW